MVASQEYTYVVRYLPNPCERYNFKARDIKNTIHAGDIAALQGYGIIIVNAGRARRFRVDVWTQRSHPWVIRGGLHLGEEANRLTWGSAG